jgi:hypothetical protein
MNFYISPEVIKAIIATAVLLAIILLMGKSKKATDAGKSGFFTNAPLVLICLMAWLGCFTLVKIVWP